MRITQVVRSDSFAGVERYVCDVSNRLVQRKHDVCVVGGDASRMRAELAREVTWHPAPTTAGAARALCAGGRRSIVHVHMTAAELAGVATRPVHRAKVVATRHFAGRRGRHLHTRTAGRLVAAGIDAEVAISHFVAQAVEGSPTVIHNGVAPADQAALAGRTAVVLQRLEPEKRGDVAIEAWAASTLPGRGWTLLVAGRGRLETELREIANSRGVSSSVRFLGHVSSTLELLGNASLMIAPAPEEPFGLAVVEAMAHGVPVIAASGGAHRETVAVPELLFPPGDVQACASILDQLADDPGQRSAVGQRLRDRQRELFLLEDHVDSLSRLYEGLL